MVGPEGPLGVTVRRLPPRRRDSAEQFAPARSLPIKHDAAGGSFQERGC